MSKKSLTQLANQYNSDKGDTYLCAHQYTKVYEFLIENYIEKIQNPVRLLEIGLNRDGTHSTPSLNMWRDYLGDEAMIFGLDIYDDFKKFDKLHKNTRIIIADQSSAKDLKTVCNYSDYFDIVIDDGYHASQHQQISFENLWPMVKSGGMYIIEDLHWQPTAENCTKTKLLMEKWANSDFCSSEFISKESVERIKPTIEKIEFFDSKSPKWSLDSLRHALVVVHKK